MSVRQSKADSELLADALKQMDGILADSTSVKTSTSSKLIGSVGAERKLTNGYHHPAVSSSSSSIVSSSSSSQQAPHVSGPVHLTNGQLKHITTSDAHKMRAVRLFNDLYITLGYVGDKSSVLSQLYPEAQTFFSQWMNGGESPESLSPRPRKTVDTGISSGNARSTGAGGLPNPHKLDVMAENSNLKVRLARTEKDLLEAEEKLGCAQMRINDLQSRLNDRTIEVTELRSRLARSQPSSPDRSLSSSFRERTLDREKTIDRLKRKHFEVEKLKQAVESLMTTNEEKDNRIEELRTLLKRYRRLEERLSKSPALKALDQFGLDAEDNVSDVSSAPHSNASSNENPTSNGKVSLDRADGGGSDSKRSMPYPNATSTPIGGRGGSASLPRVLTNGSHPHLSGVGSPPSCIQPASVSPSTLPASSTRPSTAGNTSGTRSNSFGNKNGFQGLQSKTPPPTLRRKVSGNGRTDTDDETLKDEMAQQYKALQDQILPSESNGPAASTIRKKPSNRGIKRFFGRMKRTNSQELDDKTEEFKRTGLRSTAGPRLGWSKDLNDVDLPFPRWDTDRIAMWLHIQGLSMYVGDCKRWVKNGEQLIQATSHDLDKEMGIRNYYHRKKLQLALQEISSQSKSAAADLDFNWVTRWLDDIGLPQYKDQFTEARIDGRMLQYLTVDDLVGLKVSNVLHHLSIRRGIEVLRTHNFSVSCLKRRPAPDEGLLHNCPEEVSLWSNHRVMEWLRNIDLSEYAPNLRGSGVHGGLMVYEPRFGAEVFATILSIPGTKTLLRRHLSTHFIALIGGAMQQQKRIVETQPGYIPLTLNQKVKMKKGLFWNARADGKEDFVCPLEEGDNPRRTKSSAGPLLRGSGSMRRSIGDGCSERRHDERSDDMLREDAENLLSCDKRFLDNVPSSDV